MVTLSSRVVSMTASQDRRTRSGMGSEQNLVVLKFQKIAVLGKWEKKYGQRNPARTGRTVLLPLKFFALSFRFAESEFRMFRAAAHAIALPQSKPRAMREHLIVPSVGSRDIACAEWPNIRRFEHFP